MPQVTASTESAADGDVRHEALQIRPFRALRYSSDLVPDLAAVTSPPYDVIGPDGVAHYERSSDVNVVRLILPRRERSGDGYARAAHDLAAWLDAGVLTVDADPAVFAYEQSDGRHSWLGLLAATSVHDPGSRAVLPHEDVFPGPVDDRAALMAATSAQLEPIMLVHEGHQSLGQALRVHARGPAELGVTTEDGVTHRLWRVSDADDIAALNRVVGDGHALIADGHHRYAAYQARRRAAGDPEWGFGLAWLVDESTDPLSLTAIHRTVQGQSLIGFESAVAAHAKALALTGEHADWLADLSTAQEPAFVVTDGRQAIWVNGLDAAWLDRTLEARPSSWRRLDSVVLHEALLPAVAGIEEGDPRVSYEHDATAAIDKVRRHGGLAVLMRPPRLRDVLSAAAEGIRMPRKSTSFGPKPRNGLVMRRLDVAD